MMIDLEMYRIRRDAIEAARGSYDRIRTRTWGEIVREWDRAKAQGR